MKPFQRDQLINQIFDLTDAGTEFRNRAKMIAAFAIWMVLSGFTMLLTVFSGEGMIHRAILIAMSLIKYVPMLMVVYSLSRHAAAKYLNDVYELDSESMAEDFLEHVAFNQVTKEKIARGAHLSPLIVIEDGMIEEKDEHSPLILIGGPGYIQVNLDSAALLEKVNGEPDVISPNNGAWRLGCFERIREIGESDEIGEREYAIINLREQRIKDITVTARTKDGIPVEARDVKIKFSVVGSDNEDGDFEVDEKAVQALVYQQTTIMPETRIYSGAGFPWNTTIIPLVISEIEKVISSHTADEIAVGVGQKEMELNADIEKTAAQMRVNVTGKLASQTVNGKILSAFESREKINNQFYQETFKAKAAEMGVQVNWIDIGTWQPVGSIRDKIRNAWKLARENLNKHSAIKKMKAQLETSETLNLIDNVINPLHERISVRFLSRQKDSMLTPKEIQEIAEKNPEMAFNPALTHSVSPDTSHKNAAVIARDMLKAFRKELLAGRAQLAEKETNLPEEEKRARLAKIEGILNHINRYFPVV